MDAFISSVTEVLFGDPAKKKLEGGRDCLLGHLQRISGLSAKVSLSFSNVIDSKELTCLEPDDRQRFIEISHEYTDLREFVSKRNNRLLRWSEAIKRGHKEYEEEVKKTLKELSCDGEESRFGRFKKKCDEFLDGIQNNSTYEEVKQDFRYLFGSLGSGLCALGCAVLIILHFVPGVGFFIPLGLIAGIMVSAVSFSVISTITGTIFYRTKLRSLIKDVEALANEVREFRDDSVKIGAQMEVLDGYNGLRAQDIDYEMLEKSCVEMKTVLEATVNAGEC